MKRKKRFDKHIAQFDYEFIKEKFDNDNISSPVDEDKAFALLEDKKPERIKFTKTKSFKALISAAACFVAVAVAVSAIQPHVADKATDSSNNAQSSAPVAAMASFTDYSEIKKYIKKTVSTDMVKTASGFFYSLKEDSIEVADAYASNSYAETYKQVDSVDEADIIKTDGEYIYYADSDEGIIGIYKAVGGGTALSAKIDDFKFGGDADYRVQDMFVYGDNLIVNVSSAELKENTNYFTSINVYVYDISSPENPKLKKRYSQSGDYISSRMIGETLYTVSNKNVYYSQCKKVEDYVPCVSDENGKSCPMPAEDICYINSSKEPNYIIVSAIDIEKDNKISDSKAILGVGSEIYCNEKNMYVAGTIYTDDIFKTSKDGEIASDIDSVIMNTQTQLVKITLDGGIKFTATGKVNGSLNDQFSMDEKDGYLRIATTSYDKSGDEINNLYVLDGNLKKVGEVTGFAKDESIQAVKFIGDTAYVITYEQTDPLFVIDLTEPTKPIIKGSVKISGFSTMLVPVDDNTILGIGYSDEETNIGNVTNGLKLTLFDIADSGNPKVLDSKEFIGYESQVQYNHKALVVNREKGYYAVPYAVYNSNSDSSKAGILTFEINDGKISVTENFKTRNKDYTYPRCTYVDNTLYLLNGYKDITAFTISD